MKHKLFASLTLALLSTLNPQLSTLFAQGTAFTYQGRLNDNGVPASGSYDLRFKLFVDPLGNTQAGSAVVTNGVSVANGLFMVTLDFGAGIFNGSNYWLEVGVKTNGAGAYVNLSPLRAVTPVPYAVFAENVGSGGLAAGTYPNAVTLNNAANSFSGSFAGNGAGVSNVNAVVLNGVGAGNFWQLGGNHVAGGQFIGSTNDQPVEIWVNGTRALRVEPNTNGAPNMIGGAPVNFVDPGIVGATIAGGGTVSGNFYLGAGSNHVSAIFGTIAGGRMHTVAADHAFIGGGIGNTVQAFAYDSVIGGGVRNTIQTNAAESVLGGGTFNSIQPFASYSFLGGGSGNSIQPNATSSVLVGGSGNSIQTNASYSVLGGGSGNSIQTNASYSFIGGGYHNIVRSNVSYASVGGGSGNVNGGNSAVVAGGDGNANTGDLSTVGGGFLNRNGAQYGTIAGGAENTNGGYAATIAGGQRNTNNGYAAAIGGGQGNAATSQAATIAGGQHNRSDGFIATVGGGDSNSATSDYSTVGGGANNSANGIYSTVGGGHTNHATGNFATVSGGNQNTSSGVAATVPGGSGNMASGLSSFAAGSGAQAVHDNSFVWGDGTGGTFSSTAAYQFAVRASGGVLLAADVQIEGGAAYHHLGLSGGNSIGYLYGSYPRWGDGIHMGYNFYADATGAGHVINAGGGTSRISANYGEIVLAVGGVSTAPATVMLRANTAGVSVYGTFNNFSDRNAKRDFAPVSPAQILDKVTQLPVSEWSYRVDSATRHIGPMAQDFYSAFSIGTDDKHIAPMDEGGVALAAIQGLNQKLEQKSAEIAELKRELAKLKQAVDELGRPKD